VSGWTIREIEWPEFGAAPAPPSPAPAAQYLARLEQTRAAMERAGLTHLAVYGDPEHCAALAWLSGFDPRFEEALLLVALEGAPLLLHGNECAGYLPVSPLAAASALRRERYQPFSLPQQPRESSRPLEQILREEGVDAHTKVGVVGWKVYTEPWQTDLPAYLADALRFAAGWENVTNQTALLTDPASGLRLIASAHDLALFEFHATLAGDGMRRVLDALKPGVSDFELLEQVRYPGVPLNCRMTLKCGANRLSLASARGERLERGGRFSCGIGYWGANCCRAGWAAESPADLPAGARDYLDMFAGPYFDAMAAWLETLAIGATGGALHAAVHSRLPFERFGIFLNAGHAIHFDEWPASPVWEGSAVELRSGLVLQSDVIPVSPVYYSARMEDGYALADAALQAELAAVAPAALARCHARRDWLRAELGIELSSDVLPLSNLPAIMPALYLAPHRVFTRSG
jgi:Xaa-Pro aminopeptidase